MTSETSSTFTTSKIAAFALSSTLFLVSLSGLAVLKSTVQPDATGLRQDHHVTTGSIEAPLISLPLVSPIAPEESKPYYVFLQKFPLEHTFKSIFHTEIILCPKDKLDNDFTSTLDEVLTTLEPSRFSKTQRDNSPSPLKTSEKEPFAEIQSSQWSTQSSPSCIQLGYAGSSCKTPCCSVPHRSNNVAYALNSKTAVIQNAMGDYKQLYLYGSTDLNDEDTAFRAVCHGHYGAIEEGTLPTCVSNWAGTDYNPITNNCNTFTSTLLKCVFGLTDAKPKLWVSDLMSVTCPNEKGGDGASEVEKCEVPDGVLKSGEEQAASLEVE